MFMLLACLCLFISCKKDEKVELKEIIGNHTIVDDDLDIYLFIQNKPVYENNKTVNKQAITIYSDFLKENRTSRHYSYYQVDYKTINDDLNQYYHLFDFTTDGTERSYAQNFLPFNDLGSLIKEISVKFEYSYMIGEEVFEKECIFKEEMISFDNNAIYQNVLDNYLISINKKYDSEIESNRYKLNIEFVNESLNKEGHIDFAVFGKCNDGTIYSLYNVYHYNYRRGSYNSVRDTVIEERYNIEEFYYVIYEYLLDGTVNKLYYKE